MAISTKDEFYRGAKKEPSIKMSAGGESIPRVDFSAMSQDALIEYIHKNYSDKLSTYNFSFHFSGNDFKYNLESDSTDNRLFVIDYLRGIADYSKDNLKEFTVYDLDSDEDIVKQEIDVNTNEVLSLKPLNVIIHDNTSNYSYLGLVDLDWKLFYDAENKKWLIVALPHLGGDIRGNYGEPFILEGKNKEELMNRFESNFIRGYAQCYLEFIDGSYITFESDLQEPDNNKNVFDFKHKNDFNNNIDNSIATSFYDDCKSFDGGYIDYFIEFTVTGFKSKNIEKKEDGGSVDSDSDSEPQIYVTFYGSDGGKWINLSSFSNGAEVVEFIEEYAKELNESDGGNREEYSVEDMEGFGNNLYNRHMGESEFDDIIEAYNEFESSDFPYDVIKEYMEDRGIKDFSTVINDMDGNYQGAYDGMDSFAEHMVDEGVMTPSINDMYVTDTDKRIISGEEADNKVSDMSFEELLSKSELESEYEDKKTEIEDAISELETEKEGLESDLTDLESQLEDVDGDEYESVTNAITDLESEIESKQSEIELKSEELPKLEEEYTDLAKDGARDIIYNEVYDSLENDLQEFLDELGYENYSDAKFVRVDYESVAKDLEGDYLEIRHDGKSYIFHNSERGGKVIDISEKKIMKGKPNPKYSHFVIEIGSGKIVSGWELKEDANDDKLAFLKEYPRLRFGVYTRAKSEQKFKIDTNTYNDWIDLTKTNFKHKVAVKKKSNGGEADSVVINNSNEGFFKRKGRIIVDKTRQGSDWVRNKWYDIDFGDGKGEATFFKKGGVVKYIYDNGINIVGKYKVESDTTDEIEIVGFENIDDNSVSLYQPLYDDELKNHKINTLEVKKENLRKMSDGKTIPAITGTGIKVKITRISGRYFEDGGESDNSILSDYDKNNHRINTMIDFVGNMAHLDYFVADKSNQRIVFKFKDDVSMNVVEDINTFIDDNSGENNIFGEVDFSEYKRKFIYVPLTTDNFMQNEKFKEGGDISDKKEHEVVFELFQPKTDNNTKINGLINVHGRVKLFFDTMGGDYKFSWQTPKESGLGYFVKMYKEVWYISNYDELKNNF